MTIVQGLNFLVDQLLPAFFVRFDSWMIADNVSVLGFSVAVTVLCVVVGSVIMRV